MQQAPETLLQTAPSQQPSPASHQCEAREADHCVHEGLAAAQRVVEELLHGAGEIQAASKHGHHLGAPRLQLAHHAAVVALITGDQVAALQHQPDHGRVSRQLQVAARVVPAGQRRREDARGAAATGSDAEFAALIKIADIASAVNSRLGKRSCMRLTTSHSPTAVLLCLPILSCNQPHDGSHTRLPPSTASLCSACQPTPPCPPPTTHPAHHHAAPLTS